MTDDISLVLGEPGYPDFLASTPDAPKVLHVRGALKAERTLALVGSRRPTPYGRRMASKLAAEAARAGIITVSGLARGIDTEVHRATLEAGGITMAVLGSGLDQVYPPENRRLAEAIVASGGAVISELPAGEGPAPWNFPRRNRIISGLSWGTVVVEGDFRSGALITARCALEQGREVFAVPGPADSPLSEGPHRLLRDGACLATSLTDILEELPMLAPHPNPLPEMQPTIEEQKILQWIGSETACFEDLIQKSGWEAGRLSRILMAMEIEGLVSSYPGQCYARA